MRLYQIVALLFVTFLPYVIGCTEAQNTEKKDSIATHVFTWSQADGYGKDASYKFDGKDFGKGKESLSTLKKSTVEESSIVEIHFPTDSKLRDRDYFSPYSDAGIVNVWQKRGAKFAVYWGEKKLKCLTITWKGYPEADAKIEDTEFYANGITVGKGEVAFKMLREIDWIDENTYIQVLHPSVVQPSGDAHLLMAPFKNEDFIYTWKGKGAIVELLQERHL